MTHHPPEAESRWTRLACWSRDGAVGLLLALTLGACISLHTDPNEIVAIQFEPFAWPSVVAGDTLRDASGRAVPLVARLFDASGAEVTGQAAEFVTRDTSVSIVTGNFLIAHPTATGTARLYASAASLQSSVRLIPLVPRPDSLAPQGTMDTLRLGLPDSPANTSVPVGVTVISKDSTGTAKPVPSWIVNFTASYRGNTIARGDTSLIYLVDDAGRPSDADTTDAQGTASRRVRFKAVAGNLPQLDSVIVTAAAAYRGGVLAGAPVRRVLPVKPRT
jgi:hypothetical protein